MKEIILFAIGLLGIVIFFPTFDSFATDKVVQLRNVPFKYPLPDLGQNIDKISLKPLEKVEAQGNSFGIWIEAEGPKQPLNNPAELAKLLKFLETYPVSDIYVQVYRNGKSWFPSRYADQSPYHKMRKYGFDPLRRIIEVSKSKKNPIKVHVWFNALRLGSDANSKVLKYLGKESVLVSTRGESLADSSGYGTVGCRPDTPGIWLDPENKRVSALLLNVFLELYQGYPEIDGLHLDMLRSPFPYSATSEKVDPRCSSFMSVKDHFNLTSSRAGLNSGNQIEVSHNKLNATGTTVIVQKFRRAMNRLFPNVELSAAVLSNQRVAVTHAKQNWPQWIADGLLDKVVTMNYTTDYERFKRESIEAFKVGNGKVSIGLGAWLALKNTPMLINQINFLQKDDPKKFVLFSYGNLSNPNGEKIFKEIFSNLEN